MVSATEGIYKTKPERFEQSGVVSGRLFKKWPKASREDRGLFHIMCGDVCSGKSSVFTNIARQYLGEQMYRPTAKVDMLETSDYRVKVCPSIRPIVKEVSAVTLN